MLKEEFETLISQDVTIDEYKVIERCYIECDNLFPSKKEVAEYYQKLGIQFFYSLAKDIDNMQREKETKLEELKVTLMKKNEYIDTQISAISSLEQELKDKTDILAAIGTMCKTNLQRG